MQNSELFNGVDNSSSGSQPTVVSSIPPALISSLDILKWAFWIGAWNMRGNSARPWSSSSVAALLPVIVCWFLCTKRLRPIWIVHLLNVIRIHRENIVCLDTANRLYTKVYLIVLFRVHACCIASLSNDEWEAQRFKSRHCSKPNYSFLIIPNNITIQRTVLNWISAY